MDWAPSCLATAVCVCRILFHKLDVAGTEPLAAISPAARDMLGRLLCRSPKARITAADALQHPWLQQAGAEEEEEGEEAEEELPKPSFSRLVVQRMKASGIPT